MLRVLGRGGGKNKKNKKKVLSVEISRLFADKWL
jgi:hypothetical protein